MDLRAAILSARKRNTTVRREGLRVKQDGSFLTVNLEVIPVRGLADERNYLVLFEPAPSPRRAKAPAPARPARRSPAEGELERLHRELAATKEFLQSIVEDREHDDELRRRTRSFSRQRGLQSTTKSGAAKE